MKIIFIASILAFTQIISAAHSAPVSTAKKFSAFKEEVRNPNVNNPYYKAIREKQEKNFKIDGSIRNLFGNIGRRIEIPGVISAQEFPQMGVIVGPRMPGDGFREGDQIFIRWLHDAPPTLGESYAIYTPSILLQNKEDFTDFSFTQRLKQKISDLPSGKRLAGFLYESIGELRIESQDQSGLYSAKLERATAPITLKDRLMPLLPIYSNVNPSQTDNKLNAVIVAGNPVERISAAKYSYVYINRGAKDGVRVGNTFRSVESMSTIDKALPNADRTTGELIVVHVNDHYSTAMITQQFDVIRVGSLLRGSSITDNANESFSLMPRQARVPVPANDPEQPMESDNANTAMGENDLDGSELSEAEKKARERRSDILGLTEAERNNLMTLDKEVQAENAERTGGLDASALDGQGPAAAAGAPNLPPPPTAFAKNPAVAKKDKAKDKPKPKKPSGSDEAQLNNLIQQ